MGAQVVAMGADVKGLAAAQAATSAQVVAMGADVKGLAAAQAATSAQVVAMGAQVVAMGADVKGLAAAQVDSDARASRMELRLDAADARASRMELRLDDADARASRMELRLDSAFKLITDMHNVTVTQDKGERVAACARASLLHVRYPFFSNATRSGIAMCSAFKYARAPGAPTQIATAAHCLARLAPGGSLTMHRLGSALVANCTVVNATPSPGDAAELVCDGDIAGVPALARARTRARLGQPVAILGFAADAFEASTHHLAGLFVALNVDHARVVPVAGLATDAHGRACSSSDERDAAWTLEPEGYVDRRVTPGMSGGAVVDLECNVFGIAHGRSCAAGVFASLEPFGGDWGGGV